MTADEFRRLALRLPEASEGEHQGHADFRVRGKVFATLGPDVDWGMVKVTPDRQQTLVLEDGEVFEPCNGTWGRQGYTKVWLERAPAKTVGLALLDAWRNTAPRRLVREYEQE